MTVKELIQQLAVHCDMDEEVKVFEVTKERIVSHKIESVSRHEDTAYIWLEGGYNADEL